MKCKFCDTEWETKGKKGTRSRFSLIATLLWCFWIVVVLAGGYQVGTKMGLIEKIDAKSHNADPAAAQTVAPEASTLENAATEDAPSEVADASEDDSSNLELDEEKAAE